MFRARNSWVRVSKRVALVQTRSLCTNNNKPTTNNNNDKVVEASVRDFDAYRQLDKLDFMTAAKILFTTPPKKKKFGIDFHLVQLFFACMPALAVYLVAQYARYEIRRMEAELELKKKAEEEKKAKEMESSATEEKETGSDPELLQVKARLDKLEETIKEIVVESKSITKNQEEPSKTQSRSEASSSAKSDHISKQKSVDASQQDQKGKPQNEEPSQDAKKL